MQRIRARRRRQGEDEDSDASPNQNADDLLNDPSNFSSNSLGRCQID